jgi:hypothetical protein
MLRKRLLQFEALSHMFGNKCIHNKHSVEIVILNLISVQQNVEQFCLINEYIL